MTHKDTPLYIAVSAAAKDATRKAIADAKQWNTNLYVQKNGHVEEVKPDRWTSGDSGLESSLKGKNK